MADRTAIIGLGNPGGRYRRTRHNAGFLAVARLAERLGVTIAKKKFNALIGEGRIERRSVLFVLPQTYMNRSGDAVAPVLGYFKIPVEEAIVVHDDVDLDFGRLKLKMGGGSAGHRGLNSLTAGLGSTDFARVRIGVGRPDAPVDTADWVLEAFGESETAELPGVLDRAADAVEAIVRDGIERAMNDFNARGGDAP